MSNNSGRNNNRQWRLANYPNGMPKAADWQFSETTIPEPGPGELLARAIYLDVAPYMRGRISPQKNYAAGVKPGDVMIGGAIAEVLQANHPDYQTGDLVVTEFNFGWQDFAVLKPNQIRRIDPQLAPLPCWLDMLGLNGITAYFGLFEAAQLRPGDTVVVSAAAGSVGQIVGQLAKIAGCRAIALTSSGEKLHWCKELGYDDGIAYRNCGDVAQALRECCPDGVDVYFDNTAGLLHDAVMQNLAPQARITICGTVSLAGQLEQPDIGQRFLRQILIARARIQGFLVLDYQARYQKAWNRLAHWYKAGRIQQRFDISEGLENTPNAFLRLLNSKNTGKQLVKVSEEPT